MTKLIVDFAILRPRLKIKYLETDYGMTYAAVIHCVTRNEFTHYPFFLDCLTLEDGTEIFSHNTCTKVPFDSASNTPRKQISDVLKFIMYKMIFTA
jgi:hypothetical protein